MGRENVSSEIFVACRPFTSCNMEWEIKKHSNHEYSSDIKRYFKPEFSCNSCLQGDAKIRTHFALRNALQVLIFLINYLRIFAPLCNWIRCIMHIRKWKRLKLKMNIVNYRRWFYWWCSRRISNDLEQHVQISCHTLAIHTKFLNNISAVYYSVLLFGVQ